MNNYEYKVKRENPNDEFVIIGSWDIKNGERVSTGETICSLEATKNTYDVEAQQDGYLFYKYQVGDRIEVGELLFVISDTKDFSFESSKSQSTNGESKITRKAQKLMQEYGVSHSDLTNLVGRIGEAEIQDYIEKNNLKSSQVKHEEITTSTIPSIDEELSGAKAFEVHFMSQARDVIYSNVTREIDFTIVESILKNQKGLTLGELVSFAVGKAIAKFPLMNTTFLKNNKIRKYQVFNLGLAINLGKGLKVAVIQDFSSLDIISVSNRFKDLSMNYMRDELKGSDLFGATFTVTDLSSLGVKNFLPVVSKDQGAILGICAKSNSTNSFNLTVGFDHRLMDGMYAAQFLKAIEDQIRKVS